MKIFKRFKTMKEQRIPGMVYLPLLVFMGISFYQTAIGFEDLLGTTLAWAFSAGIVLIMIYLTIHIGQKRINNEGIAGYILFYFLCFIFSFAGNFNAVYTQYQTEQLYRDELNKHKIQLDNLMASSTKALNNFSPEIEEKRIKVENLTEQLFFQITDPARPGLGDRAKILIKELETTLDEKLTEFGGTPEQLAENYRKNIESISQRKFTAGDMGRVKDMLDSNNVLATETYRLIDQTLLDSQRVKNLGYDTNLKVVTTINKIAADTKEFVNDTEKFNFDVVHFESQELGKIAFSFKSGFTEHLFVAILFSLFCIFLDWAVVIYLIVRYGKNYRVPYESIKGNADL